MIIYWSQYCINITKTSIVVSIFGRVHLLLFSQIILPFLLELQGLITAISTCAL